MSKVETTARRVWSRLPPRVVTSRAADSARGLVRPWLRSQPVPTPRVVRTLHELDEMLERVDLAATISDDELRASFAMFRMEVDRSMPTDPFSEDYRGAVMDLYEWLHGSPYALHHEHIDFEFARFVDVPFP